MKKGDNLDYRRAREASSTGLRLGLLKGERSFEERMKIGLTRV